MLNGKNEELVYLSGIFRLALKSVKVYTGNDMSVSEIKGNKKEWTFKVVGE